MLKANRLLRIKFSLPLAILILTVVATLHTHAQSAEGIWSELVNLSNSGAASGPMLLPEGQAGWRVIWGDRFDGLTSTRQTETEWEVPAAMPLTIAITMANDEIRRVPVTETPDITADSQGNLLALWLEPADSQIGLAFAPESDDEEETEVDTPQTILFYSRTTEDEDGNWTEPVVLTRAVIDWQLVEDATGQLYLFYLRTEHNENAPAGLYYIRSSNGGSDWSDAQLINANIYLRLLVAEDAHVQSTTDGSTTLHVVWDNPHLKQSFYVRSTDGGATWSEPEGIGSTEEPSKRVQIVTGTTREVLRLWDATPEGTIACVLYQQRSTDAGATWSTRERVLETLSTCPATWRFRHSARGNIFWVGNEGSESITIAAWDGTQWSDPKNLDFRFEGTAEGTPLNLTSLQVALLGEALGVVGTGQDDGEVWFLESDLNTFEWAFAPPSAWSDPIRMTSAEGVAENSTLGAPDGFPGLPTIASQNGVFHLVWSESSAEVPNTLYYSMGSGDEWSRPAPVRFVSLPGTTGSDHIRADEPTLVEVGEQLHLVWSGGDGGQIFHSVTVADAVPAWWSEPRPLSPNGVVACCPSLTADSQGVLHIVYAVPLNESRGLYYIRSEDKGTTWSKPTPIFDAAAEGWELVTKPRIAVDNQGHIHVAWLRGVAPGTRFGSTEGIYYAHSRDKGVSWSEPTQLMQGLYEWPLLVANGTDQLHVVGRVSNESLQWISRRSDDGGIGWSRAEQIPGFGAVTGPVGMVTDGAQALYLLGLRQENERESDLLMTAWNGSGWSPPESYRLNIISPIGVVAALDGTLGQLLVSFQHISEENGVKQSALWTTKRAVPTIAVTPGPTFTPQPTQTPQPTIQPTATKPRPDLSTMTPLASSGTITSSTPLILSAILATIIVGGIVVIRSARRP
jgi:hypothetical protein